MKNSFLRESGQMWKLYVCAALLIVGSPLAFGDLPEGLIHDAVSRLLVTILLIGTTLGGVGLLVWSIHCPRCGLRMVNRTALPREEVTFGVRSHVVTTECPRCGFPGEPRDKTTGE